MQFENNPVAQSTHAAMGTVMAHKAFGKRAGECLAAVRAEITRIEQHLSRFLPDSDISRLNRSAGLRGERLSPDSYMVLAQALDFSRQCRGCFDVTIGPLVDLWTAGKADGQPPDEAAIRRVLPLVNDRDLVLDPHASTAVLHRAGQSVDLGGIGKGFAGDRILAVYREFGIASAYSNLGGNVVTLGAKPDGSPWQIGIQHPRQADRLIGAVGVAGRSVVTSGDYQRYFIDAHGIRRHHILNPVTGYPAQAGLIGVSIVAQSSLVADALSTTLFVAGLERGLEILSGYPGSEAIFVDADLRVWITPGLKGCFRAEQGVEVAVVDWAVKEQPLPISA
jgi:thiamine biosynthesis lipoprotein